MKKILSILVALLIAAPAMAGVTITCQEVGIVGDPEEAVVEIRYQVDMDNPSDLARAFALDISVTDGNVALDELSLDPNYWVYPGQITIEDGNVTAYGLPVASGNGALLPPSGMTIEMASLYPSGATPPDVNGVLCKVQTTANCTVNVAGNATRGNAVMESGASVDVDSSCDVTGLPEGCQCFGELTGDGNISIADMVAVGSYLNPYSGSTPNPYTCDPIPPGDECYDTNHDDKISMADMIAIGSFLNPYAGSTPNPYTAYGQCMP